MATAAMVAAVMGSIPSVDLYPAPRLIPRDKAPIPPQPDTNFARITGRAHQGEAEKARRRRQMERAAKKREKRT